VGSPSSISGGVRWRVPGTYTWLGAGTVAWAIGGLDRAEVTQKETVIIIIIIIM
jgi:hypothetical protein